MLASIVNVVGLSPDLKPTREGVNRVQRKRRRLLSFLERPAIRRRFGEFLSFKIKFLRLRWITQGRQQQQDDMILLASQSATYLCHRLQMPLQIRRHFLRTSEISAVDRRNRWQTLDRFQIRTRDNHLKCGARRKPETATVDVGDDRLRRIARYLLWTAEAVYILWLFLLPFAPVRDSLKNFKELLNSVSLVFKNQYSSEKELKNISFDQQGDPVWAISSETVNSLLGLSLNFFFVLPLANSGTIQLMNDYFDFSVLPL